MMSRRLMKSGAISRTYATFDPERKSSAITLSNENLTATLDTYPHKGVFLTVNKTAGMWAVELSTTEAMSGNRFFYSGLADNFNNLEATLGAYLNSLGRGAYAGQHYKNGVLTSLYWGGYTTPQLMVVDFNLRKILAVKDGVLKASEVVGGTSQLYVGVSLYDTLAGTFSVTLNAGQSAFSSTNESLIAAYETSNGVTINRGLWA